MPLPIEDYAIIGDCETAALVGRDGSIDWLCWPRFDSDACFAALLGAPGHGRWLIAPEHGTARVTRRYRPNTLILETRFENAEGAVTLVDFMPGHQTGSSIVPFNHWRARPCRHENGIGDPVRLWSHRAVDDATGRWHA
jgi:GH15 family glucan-1,4-alpha-glucosidase